MLKSLIPVTTKSTVYNANLKTWSREEVGHGANEVVAFSVVITKQNLNVNVNLCKTLVSSRKSNSDYRF